MERFCVDSEWKCARSSHNDTNHRHMDCVMICANVIIDAINVSALLYFDEPIKLVLFFKQTNKKIDMISNCKQKSVQFFRWLTRSLTRLSPCTHSNAYRLLAFFSSKTLFWKAISLDTKITNFSNWVIATMCAWCDSIGKKCRYLILK